MAFAEHDSTVRTFLFLLSGERSQVRGCLDVLIQSRDLSIQFLSCLYSTLRYVFGVFFYTAITGFMLIGTLLEPAYLQHPRLWMETLLLQGQDSETAFPALKDLSPTCLRKKLTKLAPCSNVWDKLPCKYRQFGRKEISPGNLWICGWDSLNKEGN